jgi:two-component system response regulator VicR
MALERDGHQTEVASNGKEAMEKVKNSDPDLILLDLLLPELAGLEFLKLYDVKKHPQTQIVVISNLSSPELLRKAKNLGVKDYLTKINFTPTELAAYVKGLLADREG